jgi:hypothetical protein
MGVLYQVTGNSEQVTEEEAERFFIKMENSQLPVLLCSLFTVPFTLA